MALGLARRDIGQKSSVWDQAKNDRLVRRLDRDQTGAIEEAEFVNYFNFTLAKDREAYSKIMKDFKAVALSLRNSKLAKRSVFVPFFEAWKRATWGAASEWDVLFDALRKRPRSLAGCKPCLGDDAECFFLFQDA